MVVHSKTYFWIALDTGTAVITVATTAMHSALFELFQELPWRIHDAISTGSAQIMTNTFFWVEPVVLDGGYCIIAIWSANQRTRYHLCCAAGRELRVWNGLAAFFWELPGDWMPGAAMRSMQQALEVQVQRGIRHRLAQGGRFSVLRYDPGEAPRLSMVFNRYTLEQLQNLLAAAFADALQQPRRPQRFCACMMTLAVGYTARPSGGHLQMAWRATMSSEDGARYLVATNWPFFYLWDGVLAED